MVHHVRRREFIALVGGASVAWPVAIGAQQPARMTRIGYLGFGTAAATADRVEALRAGLRDLGYLEGKNIVIDFRWAEVVDRLRELAAELVREKVDVIFATSSTEVQVAQHATKTIPIVFSTHFDPVGSGHVASLARPGGNVTGLAAVQTDFTGKSLEMLKDTLPHMKKIGVLWSPNAHTFLFCRLSKLPLPKWASRFNSHLSLLLRSSRAHSRRWSKSALMPFLSWLRRSRVAAATRPCSWPSSQ